MIETWHEKFNPAIFCFNCNKDLTIGITSVYISHKLFFTISWNEQIFCSFSLLQLLFISQEADLAESHVIQVKKYFVYGTAHPCLADSGASPWLPLVSPSHPSATPECWDSALMGPIWAGWARRKSPLSQQRAGLSAHRLRAEQQPTAGQNKLTVIYCPLPPKFFISAWLSPEKRSAAWKPRRRRRRVTKSRERGRVG